MKAIDRIKEAWNENPLAVIGVAAVAATAAAKLIDSIGALQGRRAYAKQVSHRVRTKK